MDGFIIKPASPDEHDLLTALAIESKKYWGYPEEWITGWIEDLTLTPAYIESNLVFKLVRKKDDRVCGFCALEYQKEKSVVEISHLWLKPRFIGKNLGKYLFEFCLKNLKLLHVEKIRVVSDPNAQGFYENLGFVLADYVDSTPVGRKLPELVLDLT